MKHSFIIIFILFFACSNASQNDNESKDNQLTSKIELVDYVKANELLAEGKELIVLDVRTKAEVDQGIIKGAINIDYLSPVFKQKIEKLDKSSKILVYCAAGGRSAKAAIDLKNSGFTEIYDLKGGYNGWKDQE